MRKANPRRSIPSATAARPRASARSTLFSRTNAHVYTRRSTETCPEGDRVVDLSGMPGDDHLPPSRRTRASPTTASRRRRLTCGTMSRSRSRAMGAPASYGVERSGRRVAAGGGEEGRRTGRDRAAQSGAPAAARARSSIPKTFDFDERTANARAPEMIPHVKTIIDAA